MAFVKKGTGIIKVNGAPITLLQPEILQMKSFEPFLLIGMDKFQNVSMFVIYTLERSRSITVVTAHKLIFPFRLSQVDVRVRVKGGGTTSQIYAIRQAIAKGIVAYYQKCKKHGDNK